MLAQIKFDLSARSAHSSHAKSSGSDAELL
jgi:hypothetical protein